MKEISEEVMDKLYFLLNYFKVCSLQLKIYSPPYNSKQALKITKLDLSKVKFLRKLSIISKPHFMMTNEIAGAKHD